MRFNSSLEKDFKLFARSKTKSSTTSVDKVFGFITPYIMEEREMNVTQMDVFSRMMIDRVIFLGTPIDDEVSNVIQAQLLYLESTDNTRDIQIYINSGGGEVYAGFGIYDTMQFIEPKIATICTGLCASMAAVLLCAGTNGMRSALPHSRIMIHQILGAADGQESDIAIMANQIKILKSELYDILSNHTGQTKKKIEKDADRDYWMSATEAKDYGIIDNVLYKKK